MAHLAPVERGTARKRHPMLQGREKGVWHPDVAATGLVSGYPRTLEAFQRHSARMSGLVTQYNAAGITRSGVPVPAGWAGRRAEVIAHAAEARAKADGYYDRFAAMKLLPAPTLVGGMTICDPATDEGRFELAMKQTLAVILDPTTSKALRASASKTVMEFTRAKPASTSLVTVAKAEDFLDRLLAAPPE